MLVEQASSRCPHREGMQWSPEEAALPGSHGFESHSCLKHHVMSHTGSASAFSLEDRLLESVNTLGRWYLVSLVTLCWKIPNLGSGEAGGPWTSGYCHGT